MDRPSDVMFRIHYNGVFKYDPLRHEQFRVVDMQACTTDRVMFSQLLDIGGLKLIESDVDIHALYDLAEKHVTVDLFVLHLPQNLAEYYHKNLCLDGSDEEVTSKNKDHELRKKHADKGFEMYPPLNEDEKVMGDQTADLQYLGTHENNGWRTNVHTRLGSHDVHDRLGRRRSLSESPSSDSEDSRRKRRKRVSSSLSDSSDNEDEETGHWKSRNGYRNQEDEDMSIDGFEELRRAFRLNFTQRKKCAKNLVELARVKQRQGESRAPMWSATRTHYTPLIKTPKEILATKGANFPKPPLMRTLEERRVGNGYCEYHRQKGHTTNEFLVDSYGGLKLIESDVDIHALYDLAEKHVTVDLFVLHLPQNLAEYYHKNLCLDGSDEEVTSKNKDHELRKKHADKGFEMYPPLNEDEVGKDDLLLMCFDLENDCINDAAKILEGMSEGSNHVNKSVECNEGVHGLVDGMSEDDDICHRDNESDFDELGDDQSKTDSDESDKSFDYLSNDKYEVTELRNKRIQFKITGAEVADEIHNEVMMKKDLLKTFFEKQKLTEINFMEWYRNLWIVLPVEDNLPFLEKPIPALPVPAEGQLLPPDVLNTHSAWVKASKEIAGLMLMTIDPDIQKNLEHLGAYDMLKELKTLYAQQADQELLQTNYNMHIIGKTVTELHAMLKLHEQTLPPKEVAPALHAIRAGRIQKNQKKKSHKAAKGNQRKGKAKMGNALVPAPSFSPIPKNPPTPKKDNLAKDAICYQCGEVGHWRMNCSIYLAELMKKKKLSQGASTSGSQGK
nr:zinc finger, CCHC-type [Tanacetum cinerariifolium]